MKVEVSAETYQVGAHFKAPEEGHLIAQLKSLEGFFHFKCLCRTVHIARPFYCPANLVSKIHSQQMVLLPSLSLPLHLFSEKIE